MLDFAEGKSRLAAELYKGAANLRLRFTLEQEREKEVKFKLHPARPLELLLLRHRADEELRPVNARWSPFLPSPPPER
jgi:hypothetical protein